MWSRTKRAAIGAVKKTGTALKGASGEIARTTAVAAAAVGAGAVCAIPPLTPAAPFCAAAAGAVTDRLLGEKIERVTRRALDRAGQEADDFVTNLRSGADGGPPPPGMVTTVTGQSLAGTVRGSASPVEGVSYITYLVASTVTLSLITITLLALRKAGRI